MTDVLRLISEVDLQATVEELLDLYGWLRFHDRDSRRNQRGLPDVIACRPPVVAFFECKTETGRLRPEQVIWGEALSRCTTVDYRVVRPRDLARLAAELR